MVGAVNKWLRRWLGIDILTANFFALTSRQARRDQELQKLKDEWVREREQMESRIADLENRLTSNAKTPKVVTAPRPKNWKQFRAEVERDPKEESA